MTDGGVGDLFGAAPAAGALPRGCHLFTGAASGAGLCDAALAALSLAKPRRMMIPGGKMMGAAIGNCGPLGWVSDPQGYRYSPVDPLTGAPWPGIPEILADLAADLAARAGFPGFVADACLVNLYTAGAGMGLHRDADERDMAWPVVSLSFGASARFRMGGTRRNHPTRSVVLQHGDALVFGGQARLCYHAVTPPRGGGPALAGLPVGARLNLTFRRAA